MTRDQAEAHWVFIRDLLELENVDGTVQIKTVGYLYVEAMLHGAKHEATMLREKNDRIPLQ